MNKKRPFDANANPADGHGSAVSRKKARLASDPAPAAPVHGPILDGRLIPWPATDEHEKGEDVPDAVDLDDVDVDDESLPESDNSDNEDASGRPAAAIFRVSDEILATVAWKDRKYRGSLRECPTQFRVTYRVGHIRSKTFSFSVHGGRDQALAEARAYRDPLWLANGWTYNAYGYFRNAEGKEVGILELVDGGHMLFSPNQEDLVKDHLWRRVPYGRTDYAMNGKKTYFHTKIHPNVYLIAHVDGNGLNNQLENLSCVDAYDLPEFPRVPTGTLDKVVWKGQKLRGYVSKDVTKGYAVFAYAAGDEYRTFPFARGGETKALEDARDYQMEKCMEEGWFYNRYGSYFDERGTGVGIVELTNGGHMLFSIDETTLSLVQTHTWYWQRYGRCFYAEAVINKKKAKFHRLVMPEAPMIDHRDHNGLNNQISNLREADRSLNTLNSRKGSNNTSGVRGVWCRRKGSREYWQASIKRDHRTVTSRVFSFKKYGGKDAALEAARTWRKQELEKLGASNE
jgi:hypothetical protein